MGKHLWCERDVSGVCLFHGWSQYEGWLPGEMTNDSRAEIFQHPTLYLCRGVGVVATGILEVS